MRYQVEADNTLHVLGFRLDQRPLSNSYPIGSGVKRPKLEADLAPVSRAEINKVQDVSRSDCTSVVRRMVHSFEPVKKLPRNLWNPKIHCCIKNSLPRVSILSQIDADHAPKPLLENPF